MKSSKYFVVTYGTYKSVLFSCDHVDSVMKFLNQMQFFTQIQPMDMGVLDLVHIKTSADGQD